MNDVHSNLIYNSSKYDLLLSTCSENDDLVMLLLNAIQQKEFVNVKQCYCLITVIIAEYINHNRIRLVASNFNELST